MSDFFNVDLDDDLFGEYFQSLNTDNQSKYYSVSSFAKTYENNDRHFSLCTYNIRSFNADHDAFTSLLESLKHKFDIIALTETRFVAGNGLSLIHI